MGGPLVPPEERPTFCRICEPHCGLVATVDGGRVERLRPDPEHPLSRGYACPKGIAFGAVQHDPDRVTQPLRRTPDGTGFEPVSWDEAIRDIGARLRAIREHHGGDAIGWYLGNPAASSFSHTVWAKGFVDALGSPHFYSSGSQDVNSRFAASALLYGSPLKVPIPDIEHTDLLVVVGANPFVSNGSVLSAPRIRERLHGIVERGGRVVVVDPRRTETARHFEHLPIVPDADAWLLLSLLHVLFEEGLARADARAVDAEVLRTLAAPHAPEATAARTGLDAEVVRALARDLAAAPSAALYGRTGTCLGSHGTLVGFLLDAVCVVTGNVDARGGLVFGQSPIDLETVASRFGLSTYGRRRSRVGGYPDVLGQMPAPLMAEEITTPGPGQLRALIVSAGNPVLTVPGPQPFAEAAEELELLVSIDLYVNETGRLADYVLPATTWLERDDLPVAFLQFFVQPFIQWSGAVVEPAGEAREEWQIIDALGDELGIVPSSFAPMRWVGRTGVRPTPDRLLDLLLRIGPRGDLFGLRRGGLNLGKVKREPHGILLDEAHAVGVLDGPIRLAPEAIVEEVRALEAAPAVDGALPLRLIGMRELRSHNSWMHNSEKLMRGRKPHALRMHPDDAAARGVREDGAHVRLRSASGDLDVPVLLTDEMTPGVVALPHGWGHAGGWQRANAAGGANVNELTAVPSGELEALAGMAKLNGVPVEVEAVQVAGAGTARVARDATRAGLS